MESEDESHFPGLPGYDPENLHRWTVQVVASMMALAAVAVGVRLLSRRLKQQRLWWDDRLIIFSFVRFS